MADWIETELKLGLPDERAWRWIHDQLGPGPVVEQVNDFFDDPAAPLRAARIGIRLRRELWTTRSQQPLESYTLALKADADHALAPGGGAPTPLDPPVTRSLARRIELETPLDRKTYEAIRRDGLRLEPWVERWRSVAPTRIDRSALDPLFAMLEAQLGSQRIRPFGGFINHREILALDVEQNGSPLRITLELDRTTFPNGRVDFELEVELRPDERRGAHDDLPDASHAALPDRIEAALIRWLDREGGITPFPVASKLARLQATLDAMTDRPLVDSRGAENPDRSDSAS
jgi:hypothetical protein